jgi:hypothetical protein
LPWGVEAGTSVLVLMATKSCTPAIIVLVITRELW